MEVKTIQIDNISDCVTLHLKSFKGFFLTFLGFKFLRMLYESILTDASGIGFLAENANQKIIGFVIGSTQPGGLYGRLLRRSWFKFGLAALPAFLRSPAILPRLLRAFSMPSQPLPAPNCATLMSIAVDPACQGSGVGGLLVSAFLEEARQRGLTWVNLTTDAENNAAVNRFYQANGFTLHRTYTTPEGRGMNEYLIQL